jgi:hypothetical protein
LELRALAGGDIGHRMAALSLGNKAGRVRFEQLPGFRVAPTIELNQCDAENFEQEAFG